MATAVAIMDDASFDSNTDVLAVVDPAQAQIVSVPRDLWCESISDRVNTAYASGGPELLRSALAEHGLTADHAVCLLPAAIEAGLDGVEVDVPVESLLAFWYPRRRGRPIEEGRRLVVFEPPAERLAGERLHEWIGARVARVGFGSDLGRIERQQQLLRALLRDGIDFSGFLSRSEAVAVSSPEALVELRKVSTNWRLSTLPGLQRARIDGKEVLRRG
jgi:anionic cell wall polymer biosynthesis LytR-Cps2A-Psr (LCP) family protein